MRRRLGILADDLTGAMDAGVQLTRTGSAVEVALRPRPETRADGTADAVVVDTESRNLRAADAYAAVRDAAASLAGAGMPLFYKKIDSTLRGNAGTELHAVIDARPHAVCLVAPALPAAGRTTRGGIHYVDGIPLAETEFARDSLKPCTSSRIADIIAAQSDARVVEIGAGSYGGGGTALVRSADSLRARGIRIVICDAQTDADLDAVAAAADALGERAVPCGSAGLLDRIAVRRAAATGGYPSAAGGDHGGSVRAFASAPILAVSGSPARATRTQIDRARAALPDLAVVTLRLGDVFGSPAGADRETERIVREAAVALEAGKDVIVDGASEQRDSISRADGEGALAERSAALRGVLARAVAEIADRGLFRSLVLIGGNTAIAACRALGSTAIGIVGEIERYVPAGRIIGGTADGMPVVTKAGGFGTAECIAAILERLRADA